VSIPNLLPEIDANRFQIERDGIDYVIASNVYYGREDLGRAGVDPLPSKEEMVAVSKHPVRVVKERD
jgi:hypothetical protein